MNLEGEPMETNLSINGNAGEHEKEILTAEALCFAEKIERTFRENREKILAARADRQRRIDAGELPTFLTDTRSIRSGNWKVAAIPKDLLDRRVEITGPSGDAKMVINAFNSGANVYMSDFEDSQSPTWKETVQGQWNLSQAVRRKITYQNLNGKNYQLNEKIATLMVRPRGWHLPEKHVLLDKKPVSGGLLDFSLFFYHNGRELLSRGSGPYFYLPKMESHLEARLWNDVFNLAQDDLKIPRGSIRATVLIETILAAFEMDEILYELKDHSAGLNCGRWDYIFSFIKKFSKHPQMVLPDRSQVTMDKGFLAAYVELLIQTCHKRGIHAMGGMAAQIPIKDDAAANKAAMEKVRLDKIREVQAGHDGTWVAHPGLVELAKQVFDVGMASPHQIDKIPREILITPSDLLRIPHDLITENGLRNNISIGIQYLESWLRGSGCVPLNNLMEDAATAEISRAQVWQWVRNNVKLADKREVNSALVHQFMVEELDKVKVKIGKDRFDHGQFATAARLFKEMLDSQDFPDFLTLKAYQVLDG